MTQELMRLKKARITPVSGNQYKIFVMGKAPTPGWKIKLEQKGNQFFVKGTRPKGFIMQVIATYMHTTTVRLDVKEIIVVGSNQRISLQVPGGKKAKNEVVLPKAPELKQKLVQVVAASFSPRDVKYISVPRGNFFIVQVYVRNKFGVSKTPQKSTDFECLSCTNILNEKFSCYTYFCKMNPKTEARSFDFVVTGFCPKGTMFKGKAQIMVKR